jgi:Holliday junction resolvase RusA-like endonuclease
MKVARVSSCHFRIDGAPVSVNRSYFRAKMTPGAHRKGLVLTPEARDFRNRCAGAALVARPLHWPKFDNIIEARITITAFNSKADIDAPAKSTLDALEGILFKNDRIVKALSLHRELAATPAPYIEVEVVVVSQREVEVEVV